MITDIIFYVFSFFLLSSAVAVVSAKNPVHSVLALISCFVCAGALFVLQGAEFVAFVLIIVYAGAVAVLFLFVVMTADVTSEKRKALPTKEILAAVLLAALLAAAAFSFKGGKMGEAEENIRAIGRVMYTEHFYVFQLSGLVLLAAMVGAISISLRPRTKLDISLSEGKTGIRLENPKTGEGVR